MVEHILPTLIISYTRLFLKRKFETRIKPDVNKLICAEQAKEKSHETQ